MTRLMRTSEVIGRPVVTQDGNDIAQVKDVIYSAGGGAVGGFTLAGRGLFAGPLKQGLPWSAVTALGPEAVMVHSENAMSPVAEVLDASALSGGSGGNVLGSEVLTDTGILLGTVVDVILEVSDQPSCDVVGYEVSASENMGTHGGTMFLPLPDTLSASGEHVMVPAAARDFVAHDLAGFGAAVQAFRKHLRGAK